MKTLQQIKDFANSLSVGDVIKIMVTNGTCRNGSSPYYTRTGIFDGIKPNKYGDECICLLVGVKKRKYMYRFEQNWYYTKEHELVKDEYCKDIKDIYKA